MGAYKQFNSQDIIITPFEVNKGFSFSGNNLTGSDVGIDRFIGQNGNFLSTQSTTGKISGSEQYEVLIYDSIKHLYYSNYLSGSGGFTSDAITSSVLLGADREGDTLIGDIQQTNYYNYEQTTLWPNKSFPTSSIGVISIPSKLFGNYIQPNSLLLEHPESGSIIDDGEGRLLWKNVNDLEYSYILGNVIYQHGIVTLFDTSFSKTFSNLYGQALYDLGTYGVSLSPEELLDAFITSNNVTCSFSSSYELFETQYKCTISEKEFNYTLNPTVLSGSQGNLYPHFTGSYFDPYVTTVGLYSPDYELIAIGKLAKPLPTSRTTDTTILINIDR